MARDSRAWAESARTPQVGGGIADFLRGNKERNHDANPYGNGTVAHLAVEAILATA